MAVANDNGWWVMQSKENMLDDIIGIVIVVS